MTEHVFVSVVATMRRCIRRGWLALRRDRVALGLHFVLPIAFFSLLALVFGDSTEVATGKLPVAVVDEDRSPRGAQWLAALAEDPALELETSTRAAAMEQLLQGTLSGVVVIGGRDRSAQSIELHHDAADPVAARLLEAVLRDPAARDGAADSGEIVTAAVPTRREVTTRSATLAHHAAGSVVLFLLFSMVGLAGTLLDQRCDGRLRADSPGGITGALLGQWLWCWIVGVVQVTLVFVWGAAVFDLDLLGHVPGFVVMTTATVAAAAAFGIVLATACRTRMQLSGVSTMAILLMAAIGGSVIPRYEMPEPMKDVGMATFNTWAVDGYEHVFWLERRADQLLPHTLALVVIAVVLLSLARILAARWRRHPVVAVRRARVRARRFTR